MMGQFLAYKSLSLITLLLSLAPLFKISLVAISLSYHANPSHTMPSFQLTENVKYEYRWEDLDQPNPYLDTALAFAHQSRAGLIQTSKQYRPISGQKRVAKYKEKQANRETASGEPQVEVMQSITATPVLKHASFEVCIQYPYPPSCFYFCIAFPA